MGPGGANILVPIAFFSWPPIVILLFKNIDKRLVPVIAYVAGWMFLPCADYDIFLLHNTKGTVIGFGILAGAYIFDKERLFNYQFSTADIPIILFCMTPFFSSYFNDLGVYDGLSSAMYTTIMWGLPYYIGRVYFKDTDILRNFALTILIGGIIYIPFCWVELLISPQLHRMTYGYHQHNFLQTLRDGGGYRPMVYMTHGLMTAMWMMLASFLGAWLYFCKQIPKKILFIPSQLLLLFLIFTFVVMQSVAAISYLLIGLVILYFTVKAKQYFLIMILLICPHLYIFARLAGSWDGRNFSDFVAEKFSPTRAQSVQFRFDNETVLMEKAKQGTLFGWGGYGRSRVFTKSGKDLTVTDGLWIIVYGGNGIVGLTFLILTIQVPVILFMFRVKPEQCKTKAMAAPAAMAVFLAFTMIDNLLNAMANPIYMLFCGGISGLLVKSRQQFLISMEETMTDIIKEIKVNGTRFIAGTGSQESRFIN